MRVSEFDYSLPPELIAQHPAKRRSASRLLHLEADGKVSDLAFESLPDLVDARDTLVLNDTRVIKARLFGAKSSGGRVEIFVERILSPREALALMRAGHSPRPGTQVLIDDVKVSVEGREGDLYRVRFSEDIEPVLERHGSVPLPPYITHVPDASDAERYQTVYASRAGAVAAPTAGLAFRRGAPPGGRTRDPRAGAFDP